MVKKIILTTIIIMAFILVVSLFNTIESRYTRDVTVKKIEGIVVTVEDKQGYIWEFKGDSYKIGQHITVVMNDNHTSNICDDEIIGVKD